MAIKLTLNQTERVLFCGSKWWGDPDMPENMQYPTIEVTEDGEKFDYPLTFVCQINCEDIAALDPENKLPHEGMLYFFAAIDKWIGYDSPTTNDIGEWSKGHFVVKYAKTINFETFQSCMLVDDEDQALTERELEIVFSECADDEKCIKCGICAQQCPLSAIPTDEPQKTDADKCINCMRCVKLCPLQCRALPDVFIANATKMLNEKAAGYKKPVIFL